jgi:hypothetical protein
VSDAGLILVAMEEDEIVRVNPGIGDGAYEIMFTNLDILTVVWEAGYPILAKRFPKGGFWSIWLDRAWHEFQSLPEIIVGERIVLEDDRGHFISSPVLMICRSPDDVDKTIDL